MASNGQQQQNGEVNERLLPPKTSLLSEGSPQIRIRNPALNRRSSSKRPEYVNMRTFGSSADKCGPHQAAREGILNVLKDFKNSGEGLDDSDLNGFQPVHHAARADQDEAIMFLLDSGIDANIRGGDDYLTPLHVAVRYNSPKAAKVLMKLGADPSAKNIDGSTPLHFAARHGVLGLTNLLLSDSRADVNVPDNGGVTAFHLACVNGNAQLCELFLIHEADISLTTSEGKNALHLAAANGHQDVAEKLVRYAKPQTMKLGNFVNGQDFEDNTPLHASCRQGHVSTVDVCLTHGADMEARNAWGLNTALHVSALAGHTNVVRMLVTRGADVLARNAEQRVALHLAAQFGHCDVIKCLLAADSPIDPREENGLTPFLLAVRSGRTEAAKLLMKSGADPGLRMESLKTCLHLAVQNKHLDTLRMLIEENDIDLLEVGDKDLRVPLHLAAFSGQIEIVELLLIQNATASPRDVFERTPLHMAAETGKEACVKALVDVAPAHVNDTDDSGLTPLHVAAMNGHRKVCKFLIRRGADLTTKDSNRFTPLHQAAGSGHVQTVDILLNEGNIGCSYTIEAEDSNGNTPLTIAAQNGKARVVHLLLDRNADVTARNKAGMTCLDVAVENGNNYVAMEIVRSDRWFDVLRPRPIDDRIPMKDLIEKMPKVAEVVMDRCIRYSELPTTDPEYFIELDFRLLDSGLDVEQDLGKKRAQRYFAPITMVDNERETLLSHNLTQTLLLLKWNTLGKPVFWFNFITFLIYLVLLTVFLISERGKQSFFMPGNNNTRVLDEDDKIFKLRSHYSTTVPVLVTIFICCHLVKEIFQMISIGVTYFCHFTNYVEWAGFISSFLFVLPFLMGQNVYRSSGALWPIGAVAILLCYTGVILFLRRFNVFGLYVSMYIEVLKTMTKVLSMFFVFIMAFALAFFALLKEQAAFRTFGWSFAKTFMMMVNGMDYQTTIVDSLRQYNSKSGAPLVPVPEFTVVIMVVFVVLITILLINLLIGLAVGDIDTIRQDASIRRMAMQVEYVATVDEHFPKMVVRYLQKPIVTIKPNQENKLCNILRYGHTMTGSRLLQSLLQCPITQDNEDEKPVDVMSSEMVQQRTRIKNLQATVDQQSVLLKSIISQLQNITSAPTTPVQLTLEGLETIGSDLDLNQSVEHGGLTPTSPTAVL